MEVKNPLKTIHSIFYHETLGKLRTIYEDGDLLFCIYDIAKILGYTDNGKSIKRFCYNIRKCTYGRKTLNFMDAADMDNLLTRAENPVTNELRYWICDTIIPEVCEMDTVEEEYPTPENELYIIHRSDYDRLTFAFVSVCKNLLNMCRCAAVMPKDEAHTVIRDTAENAANVCAYLLEKYGLSFDDVLHFDSEKVFSLLDEDVISPEEAGYVAYDQVVEAFGQMAADFLTDWKHSNG